LFLARYVFRKAFAVDRFIFSSGSLLARGVEIYIEDKFQLLNFSIFSLIAARRTDFLSKRRKLSTQNVQKI